MRGLTIALMIVGFLVGSVTHFGLLIMGLLMGLLSLALWRDEGSCET